MPKKAFFVGLVLILLILLVTACLPAAPMQTTVNGGLHVLAAESFLADIAQNVAGERFVVDSLIPAGLDPHSFEPAPLDVVRISDSNVLVINGGGLESWAQGILDQASGERLVIEASAGLNARKSAEAEGHEEAGTDHGHETDPHFWLDPILVIRYVENIRDGFSQVDPTGKAEYARHAEEYIGQLKELDLWIRGQVEQIPEARRLLVTNHESLGYFADRYGFRVVGAVIPSVSTGASPSAQQIAGLIEHIRQTGAPAIFLETGANPRLAEQIAEETGIKVVTNLNIHSAGEGGYLAMMRSNVTMIVEALK